MNVWSKFASFFARVDDSRKGLIVPEELYRSIASAIGSGAAIAGLMAVVQSILDHAGTIFPDPSLAGLVTAVLALVLDLLRRQNQGTPPKAEAPSA